MDVPDLTSSACESHISDIEGTNTGSAVNNIFLYLSVGPRTAFDGPSERWAAYHIIRATHNGAGHVGGSGSNHNAGPCIWSPRTTAGKGWGSATRLRSVFKLYHVLYEDIVFCGIVFLLDSMRSTMWLCFYLIIRCCSRCWLVCLYNNILF